VGTHYNEFESTTDDIQRLMEEEHRAVAALKRKAKASADSTLRSIYARMAEQRAEFCSELESYLREARPSTEITSQINAMFR
jgi:hypothetical protein